MFGDVGVQLPEGLVIIPKAPDFLADCLEWKSDTAAELVGCFILYRWPARLGGWLLGEVKSANTDAKVKAGDAPANFAVFYQADEETAHHSLKLEKYARSARSHTDAWVLLGPA